MYGVGGQLLEGIRSFYENASASMRVNGELSESFNVEVGVGFNVEVGVEVGVALAVQYLYGWMCHDGYFIYLLYTFMAL